MKKVVAVMFVLFAVLSVSASFAAEDIKLPDPVKSGGIGVLDAVAARQSAGDFVDIELTPEQLSTLLWVAGGINRDNGKLTYPTASNIQDMIIFAFTKSGTYRYNPSEHSLTLVAEGDNRALTGGQPFVAKAAVDLLYIQDASKWTGIGRKTPPECTPPRRPRFPCRVLLKLGPFYNCGFAHAGLSMQGVYLYAMSQGWGARTRMNFDREGLTKLLDLKENHNFTLMQCVGPKP